MKLISRTVIERYIYKTKEEQEKHIQIMLHQGYIDSGKRHYDSNQNLYNPNYVLYGEYEIEIK